MIRFGNGIGLGRCFGFLLILQLLSLASTLEGSEEENQLDSTSPVIPPSMRELLTDEIVTFEAPIEMQTKFVYYLSGFDEDNQPVWVLEFGKWDVVGMIEGGDETFELYDKYARQAVYRILNSTQIRSTKEEPVTKVVLLLDFDQYNLRQAHSLPTIRYNLSQFRKVLPAVRKLHAAYCINVNFVAESMINLVRPLMGPDFEKLEMFGTNKAKWIPKILKKIPRDQLPPWYGGVKHFKPQLVYG